MKVIQDILYDTTITKEENTLNVISGETPRHGNNH